MLCGYILCREKILTQKKTVSGDSLVGVASKNQSWPQMQNVAITLTYPSSGIGRQVTFVAIQVAQVSRFLSHRNRT